MHSTTRLLGLFWVLLLGSCAGPSLPPDGSIGPIDETGRGSSRGDSTARAPSELEPWYEVVSRRPGPEVRDPSMRRKIAESGLPWRVRDHATGIELVLVMPGEFVMGSPESEPGFDSDQGPAHRVRLTRPYYLGTTEVTQAQWQGILGPHRSFFPGPDRPVESVTWTEVQEFLAKANEGSPSGVGPLRLPTEAEWEYACRAGSTGPFGFAGPPDHTILNFCDGLARSARVVSEGRLEVEWVTPPAPECRLSTAPAGALPPNAWGLHEMHGNLQEWCADRYSANAYMGRPHPAVDPFLPASADDARTLRGGSWYDRADSCRAAVRDAGGPRARSNRIGFRVARTP